MRKFNPPAFPTSTRSEAVHELHVPQNLQEMSPWLAMSLLQKAIRRGSNQWAKVAGVCLLRSEPERLRRRLCVVLFEDIGMANPELLASILPEVSRRGWAFHKVDHFNAVSSLIERMCTSPKCRAVDDLMITIDWNPSLVALKKEIIQLDGHELRHRFGISEIVEERAIILVYASARLRVEEGVFATGRQGSEFTWNCLRDIGCAENLISLAKAGKTGGAGALPMGYAFLKHTLDNQSPEHVSDEFPSEALISGVPSWAYDVHVRQGNLALSEFLKTDAKTARLVREHVPGGGHRAFLGGLLFRVESGLVSTRLQWSTGADLLRSADLEVHGVTPEIAGQISQQLVLDIPVLNEVRNHVVNSNPS